jgi:hypothetical protein
MYLSIQEARAAIRCPASRPRFHPLPYLADFPLALLIVDSLE